MRRSRVDRSKPKAAYLASYKSICDTKGIASRVFRRASYRNLPTGMEAKTVHHTRVGHRRLGSSHRRRGQGISLASGREGRLGERAR